MTDLTPSPEGQAEDSGTAGHERLSRELRDTRMQLALTQARLNAVEGSASWRFGRVVANAAKRPWPRGAALPRDLYRLWRERGATPTSAQNAAGALASAQLTDLDGTGARFLSALTSPGAPPLPDLGLVLSGSGAVAAGSAQGPVITGALTALTCATLAPDATVHPLLPHDADIVVESTGADLVVVEAAAMLPGNPWAYATDPAAADRGRRLARMIVMARSLGIPVILVRNVPQSRMPGLSWLVPTVDTVLDTDFGTQLARFNPVGVTPDRPADPVYAGDRDPREAPGVRALLDAVTGSGPDAEAAVTLAGGRSWRALPGLYRSRAVFVSASEAQGREQRASGARVVGLAARAGEHRRDADAVRSQLASAVAAGPLPTAEIRAGLRDIFSAHSTPVRVRELIRAAGLPASAYGGRQVAVVASAADADAAGRLGAALKRQRLRPSEVIVSAVPGSAAAAAREALSGLADKGTRILVVDPVPGPEASGGLEWARPMVRHADAGWVAPWPSAGADPAELPDTYLLDLACARECSQADAVGVTSSDAADYAFTTALETPALVRRDLLAPGSPSADRWGAHGLRLFTVRS
ncbi:MAG: hypothetical protein FWE35_12545 [Streptosporangiales bacterium]|nr:hypothetical protein [Streptosporangiales bacterium]